LIGMIEDFGSNRWWSWNP